MTAADHLTAEYNRIVTEFRAYVWRILKAGNNPNGAKYDKVKFGDFTREEMVKAFGEVPRMQPEKYHIEEVKFLYNKTINDEHLQEITGRKKESALYTKG